MFKRIRRQGKVMIDQTGRTQTLEANLLAEGASSKIWYVLTRWPVLPIIVLILLVVSGLFAPLVAPADPLKQELALRNAPPFWYTEYWSEEEDEFKAASRLLGADHVGRDVLSRIIHGARISLQVMAVSLTTGVIVGTSLGLVAGYVGGLVDELIMRMVDVWLALPFILIALVAVIVFGSSLLLVMILLAMFTWASFVRFVRGEVLSLKERDYVALARIAGASTTRIVMRHILPGVMNHRHSRYYSQCGSGNTVRGDTQFCRRGHTGAHARLGSHSIRGALLRDNRVVEHVLPRSGDIPGGNVSELPW